MGSGEWLAIKLMKDEAVATPDKLEKFMNEARLLSQFKNEHIVELIAVSTTGRLAKTAAPPRPVVYYAMRHIQHGELLRPIIDTGRFSEQVARTLFLQLLQGIRKAYYTIGLACLHDSGVAHRDIKPENLLLDENMSLVIADLGSAAICRTVGSTPIEFDTKTLVGSQEYNAPEINMDKRYFAPKADVFSAGVCLFVMVVGLPPFRVAANSDGLFSLLCKKDKSAYWAAFKAAHVSPEFRGK